jgi:uncharacterized membrane protein
LGLDLLDEEVFAVLLAIVIVGSAVSIAVLLRPKIVEPFLAIGLLNANCKIGSYPEAVFNGQNITLCIFLHNHERIPVYLQIRYKIATPDELPTSSAPSPAKTLQVFEAVLNSGENWTRSVTVPVKVPPTLIGKRVALVFELWRYSLNNGTWIYTGRWVHLYVKVLQPP